MNEVLSILLLFDWLNPFKTIAPETKHFHNVVMSNNRLASFERIECNVDNCEIWYYVRISNPEQIVDKMEPVMKPKN